MGPIGHVLEGTSSVVAALLRDLSFLIPLAGPLAQVLSVTKELIITINQMWESGEGGSYLAERILKLFIALSEERAKLDELREGSPMALRLMKLELYVTFVFQLTVFS